MSADLPDLPEHWEWDDARPGTVIACYGPDENGTKISIWDQGLGIEISQEGNMHHAIPREVMVAVLEANCGYQIQCPIPVLATPPKQPAPRGVCFILNYKRQSGKKWLEYKHEPDENGYSYNERFIEGDLGKG